MATTALPHTAAKAPRRTIRQRIERWWQSRLPATDTWALGQRNIYILPTRAGVTFAMTLLVMLLASINYQLNLGYALTFLLAGAGLVSMHMTHGTLRGLTLHLRPTAAVFAGDAAVLEVVVHNPGRQRHGLALQFHDRGGGGRSFAWCDVAAGGHESVHVSLVPDRRGWHPVPMLVLETVFPFGLFRAWTLWRPAARVLAWPRPEQPAPPLMPWPPARVTSPTTAPALAANSTACAPGGVATPCARWRGRRSRAVVSWSAAKPPTRGTTNFGSAGPQRTAATPKSGCRAWPPGCWRPTAPAWPAGCACLAWNCRPAWATPTAALRLTRWRSGNEPDGAVAPAPPAA